MTDIKSMTLPELRSFLQSMSEPAFRGKQVFSWLSRGVCSFDEMTNLPLALRERLKENLRSRRSKGGPKAGLRQRRYHQISLGTGGWQLH